MKSEQMKNAVKHEAAQELSFLLQWKARTCVCPKCNIFDLSHNIVVWTRGVAWVVRQEPM